MADATSDQERAGRPTLAHFVMWRVPLVAAVIAAAAIGILVVGGSGGVGHHPSGSRKASLPAQGLFVVDTVQSNIVHTTPLPAGVGGGDVGGGFAWQAVGSGVLQLNQSTGVVIGSVPVKGGTADVLYAAGRLWATPRSKSSPFINTLLDVNPRSGAVKTIAVPGSFDTIYRGAGSVWVPGSKHIDRIDPTTARLTGATSFGLAQPNLFCATTFAEGKLWIAAAAGPYPDNLLEVDPYSLKIVRHTPIPDTGNSDYCVAAGAGRIWVGSEEGFNIYAYDPHTSRRTSLVLQVGRMYWMAGNRGALWFSTAKQPAHLQSVNADGAPLSKVPLPTAPLGFQIYGTLLYAGFARS